MAATGDLAIAMPDPQLALGRRHLDDAAGPGGCLCSLIDLAIGPRRPAIAGPGRSQPPTLLLLGHTRLRFRDGRVATATARNEGDVRANHQASAFIAADGISHSHPPDADRGFRLTVSSSLRRPRPAVRCPSRRCIMSYFDLGMHALSSTEMNWSYRVFFF